MPFLYPYVNRQSKTALLRALYCWIRAKAIFLGLKAYKLMPKHRRFKSLYWNMLRTTGEEFSILLLLQAMPKLKILNRLSVTFSRCKSIGWQLAYAKVASISTWHINLVTASSSSEYFKLPCSFHIGLQSTPAFAQAMRFFPSRYAISLVIILRGKLARPNPS